MPDDIFQTLQLTIICYVTTESVREKKLELNSRQCTAAGFLKVLMVNHGFYNQKKINDLKNDILHKIAVQMNLYYTQVKEINNILGVCFLTLS